MIMVWILGLGAAAAAQLASLLASSKLAVANGADLDVTALPAARITGRVDKASTADPTWAAFMRGM